jgi:hypothetical protein
MLEKSWTLGLGVMLAVVGGACSSASPEKSTGTNWIHCSSDADCASDPELRCGAEGVCVPRNTGSGGSGAVSDSDSGFPHQGNRGGFGGTGPQSFDAGATNGVGGSDGVDSSIPNGGSTNGDSGAQTQSSGCFSPGQNLENSGELGAFGCRCTKSLAPNGLCFGQVLLCQNAHWQWGQLEAGTCAGCWLPDQPEFANVFPDKGCACVNENETKCIVTQGDGEKSAVCRGGTWKLDAAPNTCTCTTDAQCGYGGKCEIDSDGGVIFGGTCAHRQCEVDGVRYAVGADGIPDPTDECNTCQCQADGSLSCTLIACAATVCGPNTIQTSTCVGCGLTGGCALTRYGCLPRCATNADCAGTGTPICDTAKHVCGSGPCP